MSDRCPHLDYRDAGEDREFETARAYCTVVDRFVQPMRADVCNARYDLAPAEHCEFYREREGIEDPWLIDETDDPQGAGEDDGDGTPDDGTADRDDDGDEAGDP